MGQAAKKLNADFERVNINALVLRFSMDRRTIQRRLRAAAIEPVETRAKETFYELTPLLIATLERKVEKLDEVKLRTETAKAAMAEAKVAQIHRELVPVADVFDRVQTVLSFIYKEFAIHQPKRLGKRLAKATTLAEVSRLIKADTDKVFARLKENDVDMVPVKK